MSLICASCDHEIQEDLCFYSEVPYHQHCVRCVICNREYLNVQDTLEFMPVTPGLFLCKKCYNEYLFVKKIPDYFLNKYKERVRKDIIRRSFHSSDLYGDSIKLNKPYDKFLPTIQFHFDIPLDEFDLDAFQEMIDEDGSIIGIEQGSSVLTIAVFKEALASGIKGFFKRVKNFAVSKLEWIVSKFTSSMGKKAVFGNLIEHPKFTIPNEAEIQALFNSSKSNLLQNLKEFNEFDDNDVDALEMDVINEATNDECKKNFKYIIANKPIIAKAEEQLRNDIKMNKYEMIINAITMITSSLNQEYEKQKLKIPQNDLVEFFTYHGSVLANQFGIALESFKNPDEDDMSGIRRHDGGYYGVGIYSTDNPLYACIYAHHYRSLKPNEQASILYCKAFYNKKYKNEMNEVKVGRKIDFTTKRRSGINTAFVGNCALYHPISPSEVHNHQIVAHEYVYPNKYQIIPMFSFVVMRSDSLIVWKDENIENNENLGYMKYLEKKCQINVYKCKSVSEGVDLINLKKHNKIKLITNGGINLTGKQLIEQARKIVGSNFVCLVFAGSRNHIEWVEKMPNVLLTTKTEMFKKFADLEMEQNAMNQFINELQNAENFKFNINQKELLNFPLFETL